MRTQEPAVQVAHGRLSHVIEHDRLKLRSGHLGEEPAARLDHTRDREGVPERLAEIVTQEELLLCVARIRPGARGVVAPLRIEAAVQAIARDLVGRETLLLPQKLVLRVAKLAQEKSPSGVAPASRTSAPADPWPLFSRNP